MSEKTLYLLDGHALVYRAHYAFINRPLINSKGVNTSAITGFMRSLWDILKNKRPSHIAVSFDVSDKGTFRNELYPEYKANRDAQPEDITIAVPKIREIIEAMNIPVVTDARYEADDVIGTLAKKAAREGFTVYMVTPDKDYCQLVEENIFLYKPARMGNGIEIMGVPEVLEKWGIKRVDQVIDMLGMQGDSVDNIPGIPGIGPKTAAKLLAEYDSLEGVLANTDKLKGKQQEKVIAFAEQGRLSKKLATIDLNVPVEFDADRFAFGEMNKPVLEELLEELEFRTLKTTILAGVDAQPTAKVSKASSTKKAQPVSSQMNLFGGGEEAFEEAVPSKFESIETVSHTYVFVDSVDKVNDLVALLEANDTICFDTETTGLDPNEEELVGVSFAVKPHEAYYVPIDADQQKAKEQLAPFVAIFQNEKKTFIGQNIKYDLIMLKWYDIEVKGGVYDTMVAHYIYDPEVRHNMNFLSETFLNYQPVKIETLLGPRGKKQKTMRDIEPAEVTDYASEDADITLQLANVLKEKIEDEAAKKLLAEVEFPLVKVLMDMESEGINVDVPFLQAYSEDLQKEILAKQTLIYEKAGQEFNIDSPKQVGEVLFDVMKLPYRWRKTKTGQYSTDEEKLSELAESHEIAALILEYRSYTKLRSTYVEALPKLVNSKSGRIHTSFNQALTATGRLSSSNPNLQNIPIKTEAGREIRKAFVPRDENHTLIAADYSQIELRLIAEISKDEAMLSAFQEGLDIHTATAAKVYDVPLEEVTPTQRRNAKTVNFSIIYGAGAMNLSKNLGIPRKEAKALIEAYKEQYAGLTKYMDESVAFARENGYVQTLLGRKRYLRDINSRNRVVSSHAERNAVNTPIQGTAADMIKVAMINLHKRLVEEGADAKIVLQVHDELLIDTPNAEVEKLIPIIEEEMKNALPNLSVPIEVGIGIGNNWLEAH